MTIQQSLIAGMVAIACAGIFAAPVSVAKGNGQGNTMLSNSQSLSRPEAEALAFMREEEKLARDVYITLYQQWGLPVFDNISRAEQQHTDKVKALLQTYGVADPVVNDTVGVFQNAQLLGLYTQLVAQGRKSPLDALYVGAFIEETDIADLQKALAGTTRTAITNVYNNLMKGSRNHLRAFVGQIKAQGINYVAQAMPQAEVDAIVASEFERGNANGGGGQGRGGRW